jgi:hypothetical protein
MGLETGTYISDLNTANPTSGDPVSQADDHIRLLKATIKTTFPNVAGAVTSTHGKLNAPTNATAQDATSGTALDYTSIPSWASKVTLSFAGVSTSGANSLLIQLGTSGGVETTGYLGSSASGGNASTPAVSNFTTGFGVLSGSAGNVLHGSVTISLLSSLSNSWVAAGTLGTSNTAAFFTVSGSKALSGTLDRLRLTTSGGVDTFDAGAVNIQYE